MVVGAAGVWLGFPQADAIVGLLISVAILWVLKNAAGQVFARLMDAVDPALTEAVERAAQQPGVEEVSSIRIRWIGHQLEAEAHVVVDGDLSTTRSHEIAEGVRHGICVRTGATPRPSSCGLVEPTGSLQEISECISRWPSTSTCAGPRARGVWRSAFGEHR